MAKRARRPFIRIQFDRGPRDPSAFYDGQDTQIFHALPGTGFRPDDIHDLSCAQTSVVASWPVMATVTPAHGPRQTRLA